MFHVVLVPVVILAAVLCCCAPLPVAASVVAGGLLWRLFVSYRTTLGAMSSVDVGRTGLLDYGLTPRAAPGDRGDSGVSRTAPLLGSGPTLRTKSAPSRTITGSAPSPGWVSDAAPSPGWVSDAAPSPRGAASSPRNSSRSGAFDEPFSPVSSPSVSILSRSSYKENLSYRSDDRTGGSPMLPPGSYPWLMPSPSSAIKKRISLESVPVKIKVSKPASSFPPNPDVPEEEIQKVDTSKQIIQALKAMSRKRLHTTESDDSREDSFGAVTKKRPMDYHHNLYASHLGSSDSSFQGIPEIQEDSAVEHKTANGSESLLNASTNTSSGSVPNNSIRNPVITVSNKRPRAANDSGSQAAKKRNNNEILSSLSSSLALLDPNIIHRRIMKRRESAAANEPAKRTKTLETHCVEVQTLPSPIYKEDKTKTKEDKGTATDKVVEGVMSTSSTQSSGITEKKVTDKMAAALLKSALMKFANSGELVTPDTSANSNSILSECSLSKNDITEKDKKSVRFNLPAETSKPSESVLINGASTPNPSSGTNSVANVEQPSKPATAFTFGSTPLQSTSASAVSSSPALVTTSLAPITAATAPSVAATVSDKPSGFTLASSTSMLITPSPTESSNLFSFGSSATLPKTTSTPVTVPKVSEPSVSAPTTGFSFGAQPASEKPSFTFGAQSTPSSVAPSAPTSQKEIVPAPATSASTISSQSPFSFGQSATSAQSTSQQSSSGFNLGGSSMQPAVTSSSAQQLGGSSMQPAVSSSSAQPAASKPGGFAFKVSSKFSFGSSTTPATSTVTTPGIVSATTTPKTPTQPIMSFGNSSFGAKTTESSSKGLFGMPSPTAAAAEPPKPFGASGGFSFAPTSKDQQPAFPAQTPQKPEEKKQGFVFGGFGQKPEAAKPFAFGSSAGAIEQPKPSAPSFAFGSSSAPQSGFGSSSGTQPAFGSSSGTQPAFGLFSTKPADPAGGSLFNPPATTSSSLFGSGTPSAAASSVNSVVAFGSTTPKTSVGFGTPSTTTVSSFGSSTMTPTTSANPAPAFGSSLTPIGSGAPAFGSSAPSFGAAASSFGASTMTFGSGSTGFSSTNPPTFGSVAGAPASSTANAPTPSFGTAATAAPQFGSSTFGSSPSVPAFGSGLGTGSAFGTPQTTTQQAAPVFGAPQTTTQQTAPAFGAPQTTSLSMPAFGSSQSQATPAFSTGQQAMPAFGAAQTTTQQPTPVFGAQPAAAQPSAPAFGAPQPASQSTPFSFTGSTGQAAPSSGGFNFQASGAPKPMFQFGASGTPAQPSQPQQPFAFSGAPAPSPGIGGGFGNANTMFSIGSGSAAPRSRTTLRTRKK